MLVVAMRRSRFFFVINDRGDSAGNLSAVPHRVLFSPYQDFLGGPADVGDAFSSEAGTG
jgi:hypothetical protein